MATYSIGARFAAREGRLDAPALADKMVRGAIIRAEIDAVLSHNEEDRR